ncbi:hypothetical protein [Scytonema sp. NUACC26]
MAGDWLIMRYERIRSSRSLRDLQEINYPSCGTGVLARIILLAG